MRFGRSRVQDRVRNSEVETVIEEPSAAVEHSDDVAGAQTGAFDDAGALPYESSLFVDSHTLTEAEGSAVTKIDANEPDAIDQLRAATTAADARTPGLSPERAAEVRRLHEVTVDAEMRAGRVLATPRARRRLHDAVTEEGDALHMLGFGSYDEFETAYATMPTVEERHEDSAETIARIAEILSEIGIDPSADPLEAAREFLAVHEDELVGADALAPTAKAPTITWAAPPVAAPEPALPHDAAPAMDPGVDVPVDVDVAPPGLVEAASAIEMAAARAEEVATARAEEEAAAVEDAEPEADSWVPAARLPVAETPVPEIAAQTPGDAPDRDEEIVDRWISAEARAERMHAEVDRAQAELVALLARSAELESTVVERVNERDTAHADLDAARTRVWELEQSIARSDDERAELDAALAAGRDRIAELEGIAAAREQAYAQSERDRAEALDTVAELEGNLAASSSELEQARVAVAQLEAQVTAHAADLDLAHAELDTTRNDALGLRTELETTRNDVLGLRTELETTRRSLGALDEHAEEIEAELAEARRKAESPEARRELEVTRQELDAARAEVGALEARRAEMDEALARDRAELDRLREELTTTRELTATVRSELSAARNALEATSAKVESAERAREAITIDAAEILARAEADAGNMLERASRDAEAIRQEAHLEHPGRQHDNEAITKLADDVERLERKLSKQRRKLDEITNGEITNGGREPGSAKKRGARPKAVVSLDENAANIVEAAEREATEIRRAARRDRDRFREELVGLLNRLAPDDDDDN